MHPDALSPHIRIPKAPFLRLAPCSSPPMANRLLGHVQTQENHLTLRRRNLCGFFPPARKSHTLRLGQTRTPVLPSRCDEQPMPAERVNTPDIVIVGGNTTNRWCEP